MVLAASVISKSGRGTCCKHHFVALFFSSGSELLDYGILFFSSGSELLGYGILFFSSGSELLGYGIDENTLA